MKQNALLSVGPHQNAGQPAENAPNDQPDDEIHRTSPVQVMRKKRSRQENVPEAGSYFETDLLADQQLANSPGVRRLLFHRSEEHTSELQSLMRISYAVFCLKKKTIQTKHKYTR